MKIKKGNKNKKPVKKTRKELRKDKRQQKKVNRKQWYTKKKEPVENSESDLTNKNDKSNEKDIVDKLPKKSVISNEDKLKRKLQNEKKQEQRLAKQMERNRKNQLIEDNEREEKTIKHLEKQLKLNKRKSKSTPKSFADDGLDYLLDFCNEDNRKFAVETEKQLLNANNDDDFEEDFAMITGIESKSSKKDLINDENSSEFDEMDLDDEEDDFESDSEDEGETEPEESEGYSSDDEPPSKKSLVNQKKPPTSKEADAQKKSATKNQKVDLEKEEKNIKNVDKVLEESDDDFDDEMEEDFGSDDEDFDAEPESNDESKNVKKNDDGTWEDIYGRKRDKDGNVITETIGKYIPPAARLKLLGNGAAESEKLSRLRKQLKGLINRLAENNMHSVVNEIDRLYMSNSKNDMNESLVKLMTESIVAPTITPDRLIAEHMMLIAILHANVGSEVGAHFLQSLVKRFNEMINNYYEVENKELDNLVLMLSHLYNFKIYGSQLVYQILDKLIAKFGEKEIEIILVLLKTVGFLLRKDDPIALKELVLSLQQKAASLESTNTRIQFMLDVLLAIKNNNMSKIPQYDPKHVEDLKKKLKTYLRTGNSVTQFNISMNDLLNDNERGKWWVVGSAWTGNIDNTNDVKLVDKNDQVLDEKMTKLAKKLGMNTPLRRRIFYIVMKAEDYIDAFQKIDNLHLKNDLESRDIIHVILQLCVNESKFNPYYPVLAQKFCDHERKYKINLQCTIWDKFKTLNDYTNIQISNLAKFLSHLFIEKGLALSILKVIEFGALDKLTMRLIRQIMLGVLLHDNVESCVDIFRRIPASQELQTLREGLRLFISHFLVKNAEAKSLPEEQVQKLKERAEIVDKVLLTRSGKYTL